MLYNDVSNRYLFFSFLYFYMTEWQTTEQVYLKFDIGISVAEKSYIVF